MTCILTLDDILYDIYQNGVPLTATGDYNSWRSVKTISFHENFGYLAFSGRDNNICDGCVCSALVVSCSSTNTNSPWHGWGSNADEWTAFGDQEFNEPPSGWTLGMGGSSVCTRPADAYLSEYQYGSAISAIWPSNGGRYAWIMGQPAALSTSKKSSPILG